jgi:hypothetical protein
MSNYIKKKGVSTLLTIAILACVSLAMHTWAQNEPPSLEAPAPNITIEEGGETTTFGSDFEFGEPENSPAEDSSEILEETVAETEKVIAAPAEEETLEELIIEEEPNQNNQQAPSTPVESKPEEEIKQTTAATPSAANAEVPKEVPPTVAQKKEEEPLPAVASQPPPSETAQEQPEQRIVAAPEAPTPPAPEEISDLRSLEPPTVAEETNKDEENPDLADLPIGTLPDKDSEEMTREVEIARLIQQLEEDATSKEVAKSSLVPNQMQEEINFDNVPLGAAFRLLAEQAGFNFVEPNMPEGEFLSLRFQKMRPMDAFMKIAQARGFSVVTENGFTTLKRPDLITPEFLEVRRYRVRYIQPKWIVQALANLLEINLERPEDVIRSFPEPSQDASSYGGSNNGNSGGGGGTSTAGSTGNTGSQNIGLPTAPRWTSSLPYDEPLFAGENPDGLEIPYIFIDRSTSAFVVKTTKDKHKMVAQYIASVDKAEPQIMIETKVVEISISDLLEYGTDWSDALGKGITVNWEGARVNLSDVFNGGGSGTWSAFLTIPEASITIRAFQEMDNGAVMNMPRTMTRSGVPVSISSTITDATPAYQIATGTGGTGAVSTPSGFNTFTTGVTIDVVPQILENGMIDINVNPTVANQVGERTIDANAQTGTPKQTIPIISSRSLTTSAIVPSGMTIMLGGIVETKNFTNDGGIPVLSKIPFLGKTVFGNTDREDSRKTLIVFVTPKIIYPDQYQKVWTNEQEWRAMIEGNRADIQSTQSSIPKPLEIRKALPVKDTLNQVPARQKRKK